jgi:eukaryotic-like serine/threonine-protein kinase
MALTTEQLRNLSALYDRWEIGNASDRESILHELNAAGGDIVLAFERMCGAPSDKTSETLLPPIHTAMRDSAVFAAVQLGTFNRGNSGMDGADSISSAPFRKDDFASTPNRAAGERVGPYRLIKELGRGGMGVVWLAERADGTHARQVALKMPLVENLNWLLAARFARERNILASLEHPSIARLYDAGVDDKTQPYIAIEYVLGVPITDYVRDKKLKPEATAQLFIRVIEAVAHAHTQLVIHRDIKPSNILVDTKGEPHLLDFGIAKLLDDEDSQTADATQLTRLSGRALTLDYASPEQVNNATLGTASDVYSLGIVLYELLTGRRPYNPKGSTRRDLEQAILDQDPAKPSDQLLTANTGDSESGKSARRMRGDLDTVVLKALRKDPKQRYATAQAFADDLKRYLAYEPIAAKPDVGLYKVGRFVRRHRAGMVATAAVTAALILGVVGTTWQAVVANGERDEARYFAKRAEAEITFVDMMISEVGKDGHPMTMREIVDHGVEILSKTKRSDPALAAGLLLPLAGRYGDMGLPKKEAEVMDMAVEIARTLDDFDVKARVLCNMVDTEFDRGNVETASRLLLEAKAALNRVTRRTSNVFAACLQAEAYLANVQGDKVRAIEKYSAALESLRNVQPRDVVTEVSVLSARSSLYRSRNDLPRAFADVQDSIDRLESSGRGNTLNALIMHFNQITVLTAWGELAKAKAYFDEIVLRLGDEGMKTHAHFHLKAGVVLSRIGKVPEAKTYFRTAIAIARAGKNDDVAVIAEYELVQSLIWAGDIEQAGELLSKVEKAWPKLSKTLDRVHPVFLSAQLASLSENTDGSALFKSREALAKLGYPSERNSPGLARVLQVAALAAMKNNSNDESRLFAKHAIEVSEKLARDVNVSADVGESWLVQAKLAAATGDIPLLVRSITQARPGLEANFGSSHRLRQELSKLQGQAATAGTFSR